jgi:hypothetical protein
MPTTIKIDDRKRSFDPTGTTSLRRSFRQEGERRIAVIRTLLRIVVVEQDMLGLQKSASTSLKAHFKLFASQPLSDDQKAQLFSTWFNNAVYAQVIGDGKWIAENLVKAYKKGLVAAATDLKRDPPMFDETSLVARVHAQQAKHELEGIMDATVQQCSRMVYTALLGKVGPNVLYRWLLARVTAIALTRTNSWVNASVVATFNNAKLDYFKGQGLRRVGIDPESRGTPHTHDARLVHDRKKKPLPLPEVVEVLTAGDDDVCEQCEDISHDGPYDIDTARTLIPAHPNCRCAFIPYGDDRYDPIERE